MPKGIPKSGINKGWFDNKPRPLKRTGIIKKCPCGKDVYCEKSRINRKKFCSKKCLWDNREKGAKRSKQSRNNISRGKKGKKFSKEHIENLRRSVIGRRQSNETKEKNRLSQIKRWDRVGRKTYKRHRHFCASREYRQWRNEVFKRDYFKCRVCNIGGYLEAHHILKWVDFPELRYQINNGITLCHAHHPRKRAEEKRLIPVFQGLVSVSK